MMTKCVEFLVKIEENAAAVAALTPNLPVGKCTIHVFNIETDEQVFLLKNRNRKRITSLSISEYLNNEDTRLNKSRRQLLQDEMTEHDIKKVKIIVCPID